MAGKFGKFDLKAPFVSCAFIVRVAEARMKVSVDVAVTINQCSLRKSASKAQVFKTVEFLINVIQRS